MKLLSEDVGRTLQGKTPNQIGLKAKLRCVWNDEIMAKHSEQIHLLAGGLHLLLTATTMYAHKVLTQVSFFTTSWLYS